MSGSGTIIADGGLTIGGTAASTTYREYLSGSTLETLAPPRSAETTTTAASISTPAPVGQRARHSFSLINDTQLWANGGSPGGGTINNQGSFTKTGGTGVSQIGQNYNGGPVVFNQSGAGTVSVQSGTLQFDNGGTFAGSVEATGGASLTMTTAPTNLSSGTLTGGTWIVALIAPFRSTPTSRTTLPASF